MSIERVPEQGYAMFDAINSISTAVRNRYNIDDSIALDDFNEIVNTVLAEGSLSDFNPSYAPSAFTYAAINNTDLFRLFPQRTSTCNVRYTFVNNLPSPSTKDNTVIVDICQHEVDETTGTYSCDVDGTPYNGIEGFVAYTITSADLVKYPNGIKLSVWDVQSGYTASAQSTTAGFFRLDYATGPYYSIDTRFFVYIEEIDANPTVTDTVFGTLSYDGYDSLFVNTGAKVYWNASATPSLFFQDLSISNPNGGSTSLTSYNILSGGSFYTNLGGFGIPAQSGTNFVFGFTVTVDLYNAGSTGTKGSFIKSKSQTFAYERNTGLPITSNTSDAGVLFIFDQDELSGTNAWIDVNVSEINSIDT